MCSAEAIKKLRLGVLASHGGSNLQAIIDGCEQGNIPVEVCCVISNNKNSKALQRARNHAIGAYHICRAHVESDEDLDRKIVAVLKKHDIELICLAGYMKLIGPKMLAEFRSRIINIHPALLPKFGGPGMFGMHVHRAVLESREKESGPTIHLVDEVYDNGKILGQGKVTVMPDDTPETLAARVLEEEHKLYPEVLDRIARGEIKLD